MDDQPHPTLDRVCLRCGLTWGSHRGDSIFPDECPRHEAGMDWPEYMQGSFVDSGEIRKIPKGHPSKVIGL